MKTPLFLITLLAGAGAIAQVPRTEPVFPTPPGSGVSPGPQTLPEAPQTLPAAPPALPPPQLTLTNVGQSNIFTGPPGPRFTNPAFARITNGFGRTNGFFQGTNFGVGGAPGQSGAGAGGLTNRPVVPPGTAPHAPAAPDAPHAPTVPELPTLPGTTGTEPGLPPAAPGNTPTLPNGGNATGTIPNTQPSANGPGIPPAINDMLRNGIPAPGGRPVPPARVPQPAVPAPAPAPAK